MSGFSQIDLSKLPAPDILKTLDFEEVLIELKEGFVALMPEMADTMNLESEPTVKLMELFAAHIVKLRAEINDASRANMLAHSFGSNLENLAALFGVTRLVIQVADDEVNPPIPEILEGDEPFRKRIQLSLEGHSTAGPEASYVFWALSSSASVKDVSIISPVPGDIEATVLSIDGDGVPSAALLDIVHTTLNADNVRPLSDTVVVMAAEIITYEVEAVLTLYEGPDSGTVLIAAQEAVQKYVNDHHVLGHDIRLSGLYAALHQPGVQNVDLIQPAVNIVVNSDQAAYALTVPQITVGGIDV